MAQCISPFRVTHKAKGLVQVPCGKCPTCCARRVSGWSYRLLQENKQAESSHFVTLTYNTEHVPISPEGNLTLSPYHLTNYFKRLRKISRLPIKYYAIGEYGGLFGRPHYHAILFNSTYNDIEQAWGLDNRPLGDVHFGDVEGASIGYCLKYISKQQIDSYPWDIEKPFSRMSKKLGESYINDMVAWHYADLYNRLYCPLPDGKRTAMPRYLKEKIYAPGDRTWINKVLEKQMEEALYTAMENPDYFHKKLESDKQLYKRAAYKAAQY